MYDPKDILTEYGYEDYRAHLRNIENGLAFIRDHIDDLHIGATNSGQEEKLLRMIWDFEDLLPVLKSGDGEKNE